MAVAMTLRVDQRLKERLAKLSDLRQMPVNKLVNQALQQFVAREVLLIQEDLETSLEALRRLRDSDPDFERAIETAARAELSTADDPAQGEIQVPEDSGTTALVRRMVRA